jgi:hypothetical protein
MLLVWLRYLNGAGPGNKGIVIPGKGRHPETLSVSCRADPASAGLNLGGPSVGRRHLMEEECSDCPPVECGELGCPPPPPPVENTTTTIANDGTCFPSGSTVQTPRGKKTMADLQVGDKVSQRA